MLETLMVSLEARKLEETGVPKILLLFKIE
jgi:hypothetical protein